MVSHFQHTTAARSLLLFSVLLFLPFANIITFQSPTLIFSFLFSSSFSSPSSNRLSPYLPQTGWGHLGDAAQRGAPPRSPVELECYIAYLCFVAYVIVTRKIHVIVFGFLLLFRATGLFFHCVNSSVLESTEKVPAELLCSVCKSFCNSFIFRLNNQPCWENGDISPRISRLAWYRQPLASGIRPWMKLCVFHQ